jgi:hypothetical protein
MNKPKGFRLAAVVLSALFFGSGIVQAQRATPMASQPAQASGRMASARPSDTVRVRPLHAPGVAVVRSRGRATAGTSFGTSFNDPGNAFASGFGGSPLSVQQLLDPVPGLGFDFSNLAARDRDLGIKAAIDPATQWRLAIAERLLRENHGFAGTGGYILDGGGYYAAPEESASEEPAAATPAPQPQIIVVQAPAANQQATASGPAAESQAQQPPLPDVGEFTLVLRDGTKIEAIAFTRKSDSIVYITADGSRRTLAVADLDSAATERVNQERGKPLDLSL